MVISCRGEFWYTKYLESGPPQWILARQGPIFYPNFFWLVVSYWRVHWTPKSREGPGLEGLASHGGPENYGTALNKKARDSWDTRFFCVAVSIIIFSFLKALDTTKTFFCIDIEKVGYVSRAVPGNCYWCGQREITLRDSLQNFYYSPQRKVSISLRLVQNTCRNWAIGLGVTPWGPKYAQEP